MRTIVLDNDDPFVPLLIERKAGETQLFVKRVKIEGKRYIVCRNEAEAEKDRGDREAIVAALAAQLEKGDKALIGNSAYRRYLRKTKEAKGKPAFEIDAGKLAEEARFDGIFVLRTNAKITPLQAVLRYRDLAAGREPVLANQGGDAHAADLPFLRRRDPRPRVLLVPGAGDAEASRRSHARSRRRARMEGSAARSRPPEPSAHPPSRRRLAGAQRRRAGGRRCCSNALSSPCRRAPARLAPRRPPNPNPLENAAAAQDVVPRRREFRRKPAQSIICENQVFKSGVEPRAGAKENAEQGGTPRTQSWEGASHDLDRVRQAARLRKEERFTALLHHIDVDRLRDAYAALRRDAAPGVDGVTWEEYGEHLDARLLDLQDRLHRGSYHPQPVRRVHIPKGDGRTRPLGIPTLEDKIVQQAVRMVLEPIYEASSRASRTASGMAGRRTTP